MKARKEENGMCNTLFGGNSCTWVLILVVLLLCCNCGGSTYSNDGCGCGSSRNDDCCC